jgi:hypothetical protein
MRVQPGKAVVVARKLVPRQVGTEVSGASKYQGLLAAPARRIIR